MKLSDVLYNVEDYTVQRNIYGNYGVNIAQTLCRCSGPNGNDVCLLSDSLEWQKISAL